MAKHLGYDKKFLGSVLPVPVLSKTLKNNLAGHTTNPRITEFTYTHFSIYFHKKRRLPVMSAVNIKGKTYYIDPVKRTDDKWFTDDRLEAIDQIGNEFYQKDSGAFDRGHLVRRMDPKWGGKRLAEKADKETFRFTNCCPQHSNLNRKIWLELEKNILEKGSVKGKVDITVFAGPVLKNDDKVFIRQIENKDIQIPLVFWKVIVWKKDDGSLNAVGFLQSQFKWIKKYLRDRGVSPAGVRESLIPDDYFEHIEFKDGNTYQVSIPTIAKSAGIKFDWGTKVRFPYKAKAFQKLNRKKKKGTRPAGVTEKISGPAEYEITGLTL